jgi:hypothetical protein
MNYGGEKLYDHAGLLPIHIRRNGNKSYTSIHRNGANRELRLVGFTDMLPFLQMVI